MTHMIQRGGCKCYHPIVKPLRLSCQKRLAFHTIRFSSTVSATRVNHNQRINPPSSTLPPPLVLPVRSTSQSAPAYYYSLGRAYLSFYKTGAKAVYNNWQTARTLISRLPTNTTPGDAVSKGLLSRGEWQLIRRSTQDIKKVPLFALVFMICGEFTPLVVFFLSGVVPRTCKIPKQVQKDRQKAELRRLNSFRDGTVTSVDIPGTNGRAFDHLESRQLAHIGRTLGLYPTFLDRLGVGYPTALLQRKFQRWNDYIILDDVAIERNGGVPLMELEEIRIASEERGLDVLGKNDGQLKSTLMGWIEARKREPVAKLLLTRPGVWAKRA
ncbi:hypothetical protein MMC13_003799 [Lambiella insularis]|nr:hypothetical protein [Lambiella insularis]